MYDVSNLIYGIMWDRRYIYIPEDLETPGNIRSVLIKDMNIHDRNFMSHVLKVKKEDIKFLGS